jgi:hypothetical protein
MTIHAVRSIKYGIARGAIKDAIVALRTEAQHENFRPPICCETQTRENMKKFHTLKDAIVALRTGAQNINSRTPYPVPKVAKIFSKRS